jgi:23S rRNA (guanosine2251-2'-O)-methyltransferase
VIVYGRRAVREALRGPRKVERVWASRTASKSVDAIPATGEEIPASDDELTALCGSPDHQGVCAQVEAYRYAEPAGLLERDESVVVALDEVQDPQNLGAICRVAECAGAAGVVIGERRAAQVTSSVCKASAGAVEHLAIARVRNLADYLAQAKETGAWVYGASTSPQAIPYDDPDYTGRVVVVFGSEGRGLRPRVAGACDALVRLPLRGRLESLNVGAAAAAVMYGILQMRGKRVDRAP